MSDETQPAGAGHNSGDATSLDVLGDTAQRKLLSIVERVERLREEKQTITEDIGEVYAEAKGEGFDTKIIRKVVALRAMDQAKRQETEALVELYIEAIGGL